MTTTLPLDVVVPEQTLPLGQVLSRVIEVPVPGGGPAIPVSFIPDHVDHLVACAKFQIQALLAKEDETLTTDDEDALDDGFFVCDVNVVYQKLQAWRRLFPRIKPFYAVKCNPDPMVVAVLGKAGGAGFDCASIPEIDLATRYVSSPRGAIYANPQRAERDLDTALRQYNVRVLTFDGSEELYKINRSYQEEIQLAAKQGNNIMPGKPQLVLRILVPDGQSSVPLGEKFGAPPDRIRPLVELAVELDLPIVGTSFHGGSGNHDPDSYVQAIKLAKEALDTIDEIQSVKDDVAPCWLLDLGGGYPGADGAGASLGRFSGKSMNYAAAWAAVDHHNDNKHEEDGNDGHHHKVTAANIAEVVTPLIDQLFPPDMEGPQIHVVAEPGRYFVEEAFCLCSRIYRIRVDKDDQGVVIHRHYYVAQGVQGVFKDCVLCGEVFIPHPLKMNDITTNTSSSEQPTTYPSTVHGPSYTSTVHGPSGEDYDVICPNYPLPELVVGDWLVFDSMGAYTLSIAARSGRPSVRYVAGGGVGEEQ